MRWAWVALILAGVVGCDFSPSLEDGMPPLDVAAGQQGVLPAVVDLRRSDACPTSTASFSIRFSNPMNRDNVQSAIGFYEVLGDAMGYDLPVNRDTPVRPNPASFQWQDQDRLLTFRVELEDDRQYVLLLPETVTDKLGHGLDGRVGADVQGNGEIDIVMDEGQYARIDDDYMRTPQPFVSLPIFLCSDRFAPSIWRTPLNNPRPRVVEFAGRMPRSENNPRYDQGGYPFAITDGAYYVERPLPPRGALRLRIASESTAPTRSFGQRRGSVPVLPSTIVEAMDLLDENLASQRPVAYMDKRLSLPAPVQGTVAAVTGAHQLEADALEGIPDGLLAGMTLVTRGRDGYRFTFRIADNDSTGSLTIEPVWIVDRQVTRPINPDTNFPAQYLYFGESAFRENELVGLQVTTEARPSEGPLEVVSNTGRKVYFDSGVQCIAVPVTICEYQIEADLTVLEVEGSRFEIVPDYLTIQTEAQRSLGQIYSLLLNLGEEPIRDAYGFLFVDGREDGNEQTGRANDRWTGNFPSGDFAEMPIPPTLQLNDGRWYSPLPEGPQVGDSVTFTPYGEYVYLGHGLYGEYVSACVEGEPEQRLRSWAMTFATPNGSTRNMGPDDLLLLDSVHNSNFAAYRMEGRIPESIGIEVTSATVQLDVWQHQDHLDGELEPSVYQGVLPTTLVFVEPLSNGRTITLPGDDGICGTGDDRRIPDYRQWRPGDRLLISNRVRYPHGDDNTLDGNYDGILSSRELDDIRLEYQGSSASRPFVRVP